MFAVGALSWQGFLTVVFPDTDDPRYARIHRLAETMQKNVPPERKRAERGSAYPRSVSGGWSHLDVEEAVRGPLDRGQVQVHHVNRDVEDISPGNLVRLVPAYHRALHGRVVDPQKNTYCAWSTEARDDTSGNLAYLLTSTDPAVLEGWKRALGVDPDANSWICPLGNGMGDRAMFTRNREGELVYSRLYPCHFPILTLGEVYRSRHLHERGDSVTRIKKGTGPGATFAAWAIRAAWVGGLIVPDWTPEVAPDNSPHYDVVAGVGILFMCRRQERPHVPVPLCRAFVTEWCGCSERRVRDALAWMEATGVIVDTGETWGSGKRATRLWLPGTL